MFFFRCKQCGPSTRKKTDIWGHYIERAIVHSVNQEFFEIFFLFSSLLCLWCSHDLACPRWRPGTPVSHWLHLSARTWALPPEITGQTVIHLCGDVQTGSKLLILEDEPHQWAPQHLTPFPRASFRCGETPGRKLYMIATKIWQWTNSDTCRVFNWCACVTHGLVTPSVINKLIRPQKTST